MNGRGSISISSDNAHDDAEDELGASKRSQAAGGGDDDDDDEEAQEKRKQAAHQAKQQRSIESRKVALSIATNAAAGLDEKARLAPSTLFGLQPKRAKSSENVRMLHGGVEIPSRRRRFDKTLSKMIKKTVGLVGSKTDLRRKSDTSGGRDANIDSDEARRLSSSARKHSDVAIQIEMDELENEEAQMDKRLEKLELSQIKDHTMTFEQILEKYKTRANPKRPTESFGISETEAAARIEVLGSNVFAPKLRVPLHVKFMECLTNLFNLLLFTAGGTYLILYAINPVNNFESLGIGCTLIVVAFIYATIEFYEIQKISKILESFKLMIPNQTSVLRSEKRVSVNSTMLVPGDVVCLRSGDKVPADAILFHSNDLRVDGSSLTGESEPLLRVPCLEGCKDGSDPLDAPHLLFGTDLVVSGEGYAVVVQTGRQSIVGKISRMAQSEPQRKSPLSLEIKRFCKIITSLAGVTAVIFFFIALLRGRNFTYAATFSIGILLAWVPQGLPLTVTMILAISGRRMSEHNVLVKDLHAVETLGGITMLATDKTGTLTKNAMTVIDVWTNGTMWFAGPGGSKAAPKGQQTIRLNESGVAQILHVCVTCTRARFERTDIKVSERSILGDATESGLLRFAAERLTNIDRLPEIYPKVLEVPFTSDTKTHVTIHRKGHANGGLTLHMKGAPEVIWEQCSTIWLENAAVTITETHRQKFRAALDSLTRKGSRVLGVAMLQLPGSKYPDNWKFDVEKRNYPTSDLTFLGLIGMEDPPKEEVAEAIAQMRTAGIKVLMITGDNPVTAEVNIVRHSTVSTIAAPRDLPVKQTTGRQAIVVLGLVLPHLSDEDWLNILDHDEVIFARTLPSDKLDIVKRAQSLGHIVAVTGDGVNDSAALKKADLGIAMNRTGSDISKESAKMILLDDNFASTVKGIQEGRLIFANLKKAMRYSLTHIMPELLPYLLYVVIPIPLALTPTQILAIDLGFEMLMTLSFAWEPAEDMSLLMSMPPRKPVTRQSAEARFQIGKRHKEAHSASMANLSALPSPSHTNQLGESTPLKLRPKNSTADDEVMDSTLLLNEMGVMDGADPNLEMQIKVLNSRLRNRYGKYIQETKDIFTSLEYWKMQYNDWHQLAAASTTNERLVDGEVMLYSYIEAGLIEFAGAITTFFAVFWYGFGVTAGDARMGQIPANVFWKPHSPSLPLESGDELLGPDQYEAIKQVRSAYFLSIFVIQIWNLFACKTRHSLPFNRNVISNKHTWLSIFAGAVVATIIVYVPFTNDTFLTSVYLDPLFLIIPMVFGGILYIYSMIRMALQRTGFTLRFSTLFERFQRIPEPSHV